MLSNINPSIDPNSAGTFLADALSVGGTLFFQIGNEIWKSDGTSSGTQLVDDIDPGGSFSTPGELTNVGGTLFFAADDGIHGQELWKSDGTSSGTQMVDDISAGTAGSGPRELTNVGGTLFFRADDERTAQTHSSCGKAMVRARARSW